MQQNVCPVCMFWSINKGFLAKREGLKGKVHPQIKNTYFTCSAIYPSYLV